MTVKELIERLGGYPLGAEVRMAFDVSDETTDWEVYAVEDRVREGGEVRRVVVLVK